MNEMGEAAGFEEEPVRQRAVRVIVQVKRASLELSPEVRSIQQMPVISALYGLYKIAALSDMDLTPYELPQLAAYAVMQNLSHHS